MKKYKEKLVVLGMIIIIPILTLLFYRSGDVKTVKTNKESSLPKINVDSATVNFINEYIEKLYNKYTSDGKSKMTYTYQTYGNIISILLDIKEYNESKDQYVQKYLSYNIDKTTKMALSNEDVVSVLNYNMMDIVDKVKQRLGQYYTDEVAEQYVPKNCDYTCYLKDYRKVDYEYYTVVLAIENNKPVIYLNLFNNQAISDYEFFDKLDYDPYKITLE